jgi:ribosome-associated protein
MNDLIIDAIQDVKGKNILKLDLRKLSSSPTEFFIICEGDSSTQVKAISNKIYRKLKEEIGILPNHQEGKENGEWVLVDYFNTIVHIFYPETRKFYDLEDLWSDAKITEYENL